VTAEHDHIRIEALIRRWAKAVREGNRAGIRADHDTDVVLFAVPAPLQSRGLDHYMSKWETFFAAWSELQVFDFHDLQITCGADAAYATAIGRCSGTAADGEKQALEFRLTMGLRKIDARWRVMHEHHSLPAPWIGKQIPTVGATG
jgi:ketosteroid isomerase-like protein